MGRGKIIKNAQLKEAQRQFDREKDLLFLSELTKLGLHKTKFAREASVQNLNNNNIIMGGQAHAHENLWTYFQDYLANLAQEFKTSVRRTESGVSVKGPLATAYLASGFFFVAKPYPL